MTRSVKLPLADKRSNLTDRFFHHSLKNIQSMTDQWTESVSPRYQTYLRPTPAILDNQYDVKVDMDHFFV